ncbi:response regulator [Brachyspira pilosicoli]|uniref:response regulator n=1 Tax=Brachyspira pilosicoli TaxID=52584 RepID=UPI003006352B
MRVLVYDSNHTIRDNITTILLMQGYDVVAVKDKKHILSTCSKMPFSIAIIETSPYDEEANNILEKMYYNDVYKNIKVLIYVPEITPGFVSKMFKIGVAGILFKPFNEKDFFNRFSNILSKSNLLPKRLKYPVIGNVNYDIVFRHEETKQIVHSMILEISARGIKFLIPNEHVRLNVGYNIQLVYMSIGSYKMTFSLNIIEVIDKEYIGLFENLSSFDHKVICKFIYEKYIEKNLIS